jgi:ribonuclease P protein component
MGRPLGRIKHRESFLAVAAARTKWVAPGFVLQAFSRSNQNNETRVGFTASRKVGGAVVRNRAKRRLRALADRVIADMGKPGMDYVLIGRKETLTLPFAEMEQDLRRAVTTLKSRQPTKDSPQ